MNISGKGGVDAQSQCDLPENSRYLDSMNLDAERRRRMRRRLVFKSLVLLIVSMVLLAGCAQTGAPADTASWVPPAT